MTETGKFDPSTEAVVSRRGLEDFIKQLVQSVREDETSRGTWLRRQAHFLRRRYTKSFRGTDWPWPNAADIVMPTMDMTVDRLKPVFIRSTVGTRPVVTVLARNPESMDRVSNLEMFMDWLVETRIPNFSEEIAYASDQYLQHGYCVFKVWYDYRTRRVSEVVDRNRLPVAIASLVRTDLTTEQANQVAAVSGIPFITQAEFAQGVDKNRLKSLLRDHFDLDPDDKDDNRAENTLVDWLMSKKPAPTVTIKKREVWRDTPRITAILPEDLIVSDTVEDIQDAMRITHRYFLTEQQIRERARDQKWIKKTVEKMLAPEESPPASASIEDQTLTQTRELVHTEQPTTIYPGGAPSEHFEIWDIYTYMDLDGDDIWERVVLTINPISAELLRIIELPYKHGAWPFVQIKFEHNDKRFYRSRGIPEKLDDLDVEITQQHRSKLNHMTLVNAPVLLYRLGSRFNTENLRFIPGQPIGVQRADDVTSLRLENKDLSYEREEQILQGWVERYLGVFDANLGDQGRLTRPRTATEINFAGSIQAQISGSRVMLWHRGMARVYNMLWDLWLQWGPDKVFVRVTGESPERLMPMTRHEIQGDFDFVPTPSALNDPGRQAQEAQQQLFTLTQILPFSQLIEPRFEFNLGEAVLLFLEAVDSRKARRIMRRRTDKEIAEIQRRLTEAARAQVTVPRAGATVEDLDQTVQGLAERATQTGDREAELRVE